MQKQDTLCFLCGAELCYLKIKAAFYLQVLSAPFQSCQRQWSVKSCGYAVYVGLMVFYWGFLRKDIVKDF